MENTTGVYDLYIDKEKAGVATVYPDFVCAVRMYHKPEVLGPVEVYYGGVPEMLKTHESVTVPELHPKHDPNYIAKDTPEVESTEE